MPRYIGLDVHKATCTMVILGPSGKKVGQYVVETNAELLVDLLETIPLRRESEKTMVKEARKRPEAKLLATVPGLGPIRVAYLMAIIVSPHRFRTRFQLWQYAGLGVVMRSSSDWVRGDDGKWRKDQVQQTRGLTRHHNHEIKALCTAAASGGPRGPHCTSQSLVQFGSRE